MRIKLQLYSTILCALGIALGFACKLWFPQYWFDGYLVILAVYWAMEMGMSFLLNKYEGKTKASSIEGRQFMRSYMTAKAVKVGVTLALIAGYLFATKGNENAHQTEFAISAVFFYLINLGIETYVVTKSK